MSKPIDQEREAFEAWYAKYVGVTPERVKSWREGDSYGEWYTGAVNAWVTWQARASAQPAGGAVPDEFAFEYRHANGEHHTVTVSREQVIEQMPDFLFEALCDKFCNCEPIEETNVVECCCDEYAEEFQLLAAAPRPVSGEQKALAVVDENDDGQWADILPDASVRVGDKLYAAPPVAQDVAGLAEAVRDYLSAVHEQPPNPLKVTAAMLQMKKGLAAHRARQGEPS